MGGGCCCTCFSHPAADSGAEAVGTELQIQQLHLLLPPLAGLPKEDKVGDDLLRDVEVDDPVHQVEADEADGEEDAAVLVDVGGRDAAHLL